MQIEIEDNVPLPDNRGRLGRPNKYPWGEMDVNQSVFFECSGKELHTIRNSANAFGRKHQKKFVTRIVDGGLRVWRVE